MSKLPNRNRLRSQLAPGVWEDANGNIHFSLPDLLAFMGLEDTPENRAIATVIIRKMILERNPTAVIHERKTPEE